MPLNKDGSFTVDDNQGFKMFLDLYNPETGKFESVQEGGPGSGRYPAGSGASPRASRARTSENGFKQPVIPKGCRVYHGKPTFEKQPWMTSSAEMYAQKDSAGNPVYVKAVGDEYSDAEGNKIDSAGNRTAIVTDERQRYYRDLAKFQIDNSGATGGLANPVNVMMGGSSGAGKTEFLSSPDGKGLAPDDCVTIDCDKIKSQMADYRNVQIEDVGWRDAAAFAHEESSTVGDMALKMSLDGKYNTVLDGTGDGSETKYLAKLEAMGKNGPTSLVYVAVPLNESLASVSRRAELMRRLIPTDVVTSLHAGVSDRFVTAMQVQGESKYNISKITLAERKIATSSKGGFNVVYSKTTGGRDVYNGVNAQDKVATFLSYGKENK